MKFASIFPEQDRERRDGRHAQRVERLIRLLARERWVEHQRAGEEERDPEQAGAVAAGFAGRGIEGKAEKHHDDQREDDRGGEQFARAEFEAQFLGEHDGGGASEWSSQASRAELRKQRARDRRPMPLSRSTRPPASETARVARSSDSLRACVLMITVVPLSRRRASVVAEPREALAVEAGGGLVQQQQARPV